MLVSVGIFAQASETELSKFCSNKSDSFFPSASKLACLHETRFPLDATRCFHDSSEQLEEHIQDMHECRRAFLFAPYALVRSNSMWKQRGWHQPQHSSPNVWCRLHCETATEHLATVLYYAKIAMKLIIMSSALLRDMLILCTPLELAACFHLVEAYMHRDVYTYHCESDHCRVSAGHRAASVE